MSGKNAKFGVNFRIQSSLKRFGFEIEQNTSAETEKCFGSTMVEVFVPQFDLGGSPL